MYGGMMNADIYANPKKTPFAQKGRLVGALAGGMAHAMLSIIRCSSILVFSSRVLAIMVRSLSRICWSSA